MAKRKNKPVGKKSKMKIAPTPAPAPAPSASNDRLIMADLIAKSWKDPRFRQKLIKNPKALMKEAGISGLDDSVNIRLLDNTLTTKHVVLPSNLSSENIHKVIDDYFRKILPLPSGLEVVFVQNSDRLKHIVLPVAPDNSGGKLDSSHAQVLAAAGFESVIVYVNGSTQTPTYMTVVSVTMYDPSPVIVGVVSGLAVVSAVI